VISPNNVLTNLQIIIGCEYPSNCQTSQAAIISSLFFSKKRYGEMEKVFLKLYLEWLSKELYDLEANGMVIHTIQNTIPVTVEYQLTESGMVFRKVLDAMPEWGLEHCKSLLKE